MRKRLGVAAVAVLLIGGACSSSFAKDNAALCSSDKIQLVKDAVAKDGLTPQAAADKAGTDARCLTADETTQAQAQYAAYKAAATTAPPSAIALSTPTPSATESPTPSPTEAAAAPTDPPTEQPSGPTNAPATPKPATPKPATPAPTPPPAAPGDAGWPPKSIGPIQSNEAPVGGHVQHSDGSPAGHYCIILSSGPCAVTTDSSGNFTAKFATVFLGPIDIIIKGKFNGTDGPVVFTRRVNMTATGVQVGTITLAPGN
jgi:hypothetical protein